MIMHYRDLEWISMD